MSNLIQHAEQELKIAGLFDEHSDYGGELASAALEIVKVFSEQGHSGLSAAVTIDIVKKLVAYQPLTPLTGNDDEWSLIHDDRTDNKPIYQNKRDSSVFKENGIAYKYNGKIFREPNGVCYTNGDSRVNIEFPYVPKTEYVDVPFSKDE